MTKNVVQKFERLFTEHLYNREFPKTFIQVLYDFKRSELNLNWEAELGLLKDLAKNFSDFLVKDQLLKKFYQLLEKYLEKSEEKIALGCAAVYLEIYKQILANNSLEEKFDFYKSIHQNLLGGGNKTIQISTSIVIERLLDFVWQVQDKDLAVLISQLYLPYFLNRPPIDSLAMYRSVQTLVKILHVNSLGAYIHKIIQRLIATQSNPEQKLYNKIVECCECLRVIAAQYREIQREILGTHFDDVLESLEDLCTHRVLMVQTAARLALKEWRRLFNQLSRNEEKKQQKLENSPEQDVDEFLFQKTRQRNP